LALCRLLRRHHDAAPLPLDLALPLRRLDGQFLLVEQEVVAIEAAPRRLLSLERLRRVRDRDGLALAGPRGGQRQRHSHAESQSRSHAPDPLTARTARALPAAAADSAGHSVVAGHQVRTGTPKRPVRKANDPGHCGCLLRDLLTLYGARQDPRSGLAFAGRPVWVVAAFSRSIPAKAAVAPRAVVRRIINFQET